MSGYLFSERIIDRHKRWWIDKEPHPHKNLAGKLDGPKFVEKAGYKTPIIYSIIDSADDLPLFSSLPKDFVIKPSRGWSAKNIYVMVNGVNQLDQMEYSREKIIQLMKDKTPIETDRGFKFLIEEYLENWDGSSNIPPYDYKFFIGNCKKCGYGLVAKKAQRQAKFVSIGIIVSVILFLFLSFRY